jgi:hypothetical protein
MNELFTLAGTLILKLLPEVRLGQLFSPDLVLSGLAAEGFFTAFASATA